MARTARSTHRFGVRRHALLVGALAAMAVLVPVGVWLLGPERGALAILVALILGIGTLGGLVLFGAFGVLMDLLAPLTRRPSVLGHALAGALYLAVPIAAYSAFHALRTGEPVEPLVRVVLGLAAVGALLGAGAGAIERHIARRAREHDPAR